MVLGWRRVPEDLGHVPRSVSVEDEQTVTLLVELAIGAHQGFGGRALKESTRLFVQWSSEEVVRGGVMDIELQRGVKLDQFHQIGLEEVSVLNRRLRFQGLGAKLRHRPQRLDLEGLGDFL